MAKGFDVYEFVADKIISKMEQGMIPWIRPWDTAGCPTDAFGIYNCRKYRDGKSYSLLNQFLLGEDGVYLSFKEAEEAGGHVKKGSESRIVVFWKILGKVVTDEGGQVVRDDKGEPMKRGIPYLRYSRVFHIRDTEGVPDKNWMKKVKGWEEPTDGKTMEIGNCQLIQQILMDYIAREGIGFSERLSGKAYYSPSEDVIVLPKREQFNTIEGFFATLAHESTHSTGHLKRLNRFGDGGMFNRSEQYSKEELVAEIGSACLMNYAGVDTMKTIENSVAYLQGWLKALKDDKKMIISAASRAEKAVNLILGDGKEDVVEDEEE